MPKSIKKEFLSFIEVADFFNQHGYAFDLKKPTDEERLRQMIVELIEERKITAVFYFDGVITHPKNPNDSQFIRDYFLCDTTIIENFANNEPLDIRTEKPRNAYYLYRKPTEYYRLTNSAKKKLNLLFPVTYLKNLFNDELKDNTTMFENQHNSQTVKTDSTKKDTNSSSRNYDDKLITVLALLLSEKCGTFKIKDRPNIAQISQAISDLAPILLDTEDIYGIGSPAKRIGEALQKSRDILAKHHASELKKVKTEKN